MPDHRAVIDGNMVKLCDHTTCAQRLLDGSVGLKLLTKDECVHIEREPEGYSRNRVFYTVLRRKDSDVFRQMVELMGSEGIKESKDVLAILMSGLGHALPALPVVVAEVPLEGSSILRERDINKIVRIMTQSTPLCRQKLELFMALELPLAQYGDLPQGSFEFFTGMLAKWIAQSSAECPSTVNRLVAALKSLQMNVVAGSILDLERTGQFQQLQ